MSLAPGARFGPYEILAPLGSGGPACVRGWIVPRDSKPSGGGPKPSR